MPHFPWNEREDEEKPKERKSTKAQRASHDAKVDAAEAELEAVEAQDPADEPKAAKADGPQVSAYGDELTKVANRGVDDPDPKP